MARARAASNLPQGIDEAHLKAKGWHRHASPLSILLLGVLMVLALFGVFGGQPHPRRTIDTSAATMHLQLPERLRNGEFFEMRIRVDTKRTFTDLTLAVSSTYWKDLTINTMIPAPSEEKSEGGRYLFSYGEVTAGEALTIKFDGQINPPLFAGTQGEIALLDGDTEIATVPVMLRVYP